MDQRLWRLAGVEGQHQMRDQGVTKGNCSKAGIDCFSLVSIAMRRQEAGVSVDKPKRVLVGVIGGLQSLARFRRIAEQVGDQARVIVPKGGDGRIPNSVERIERTMQVHLSRIAPGGQERRGHVSGSNVARSQLGPGGGVLTLSDRMNSGRKTREVIRGIARKETLAQRAGALLVAIGERCCECPLDKVGVPRVDAERLPIVGLG